MKEKMIVDAWDTFVHTVNNIDIDRVLDFNMNISDYEGFSEEEQVELELSITIDTEPQPMPVREAPKKYTGEDGPF